MRWLKLSDKSESQKGFILPTIIGLMTIMTIVTYAALLQANNALNLAYKQAYIQMARVASKAAVDFAKEQFDQTTCGNYTGTAEQDLVTNDRYRITFKAEVLNTSADGYEKTIKGTGSVYLPKLSNTAKYVFDIRSEIVRTYAVCKTPDNFGPTVWLDASDTSTLLTTSTSTTTFTGATTFGSSGSATRDSVEERADDGTQTANSWQSNDLEMHNCDSTEFSSTVCNSSSTRTLLEGLDFQNVNVPKNATISSASIQMVGGTPAGTSGNMTHRIYGIYNTSSDPHLPLFTSSGSNQVRTRLNTANLHTTAYTDVSENNFPPGNTVTYDVTSVVQEMVNNANWNPSNGKMGFGIQRQSANSSASRRASKDGLQLVVNYTTNSIGPTANNGPVKQWNDKSGNGNHAQFVYGNTPTRVDNQINNKTIVRFNNGALLSTLTSALNSKREMTVFLVAKSNFSTSGTDGRFVTGMNTSATNDTPGNTGIIPLFRNGTASGFSSQYSGSNVNYRTNYTCSSTCANTAYQFASIFTIDGTNTANITANLKGNGAPVAQKTGINPGSNYSYSINQFYYGGRRNGSVAGGAGADYMNGDYAEIIIYDKALECQQIEAIEEYLRSKWAVTGSAYTSTCPAPNVPVL